MSEAPREQTPATALTLPGEAEQSPPPRDRVVVLLLIIWMCAAVAALRGISSRAEGVPFTALQSAVDPNVAPWWELTILPDIGPAIARRIVAHREARESRTRDGSPAFAVPRDLEVVSGIGPKTAKRIAPFLRFNRSSPRRPAPRRE